jgi:hypothetical protein
MWKLLSSSGFLIAYDDTVDPAPFYLSLFHVFSILGALAAIPGPTRQTLRPEGTTLVYFLDAAELGNSKSEYRIERPGSARSAHISLVL